MKEYLGDKWIVDTTIATGLACHKANTFPLGCHHSAKQGWSHASSIGFVFVMTTA